MLTVTLLLVVGAFLCTIAAAVQPARCPLWVPVLLLVVVHLVAILPK